MRVFPTLLIGRRAGKAKKGTHSTHATKVKYSAISCSFFLCTVFGLLDPLFQRNQEYL